MFTVIPSAMQFLVPLYNSPQRHYHDLNHINFCISKLQEALLNAYPYWVADSLMEQCLTYAIYFHDAIYSPYPNAIHSNEVMSALLFHDHVNENYDLYLNRMFGGSVVKFDTFVETVKECIHATEYHLDIDKYPEEIQRPRMVDLVMDIDLSGFAKPLQEVLLDSDRIFREYQCLGLPRNVMLENRIKFLNALLAKEAIFRTEYFHDKYEAEARSNIEASIEHSEAELRFWDK